MKVWVDICHTPHVLLMTPIIRELEQRGHRVVITSRDCFQISDLLKMRGFDYHIIGRHYGESKFWKLYGILARTLQLAKFAKKFKFDLSLSAGSPYQSMASFLLRVPFIIINDYEHSSVFNIIRHLAYRMYFPAYISDEVLVEKGIDLNKVVKFPGLKEEIYLGDFKPQKSILKLLNDRANKNIIVAVRPPASEAHYHNPKSDELMEQILERLNKQSNLSVIVVPRGEKQRQQFLDYKACLNGQRENLIVPDKAIDTLSLLYYSDLMIGGGGTMNREAVALGVPTYSFFCGPMGEVDRYLQAIGKLHFINSEADFSKIKLEKKNGTSKNYESNSDLKQFVTQQILGSFTKNLVTQ